MSKSASVTLELSTKGRRSPARQIFASYIQSLKKIWIRRYEHNETKVNRTQIRDYVKTRRSIRKENDKKKKFNIEELH
jgi:hypothetical protein